MSAKKRKEVEELDGGTVKRDKISDDTESGPTESDNINNGPDKETEQQHHCESSENVDKETVDEKLQENNGNSTAVDEDRIEDNDDNRNDESKPSLQKPSVDCGTLLVCGGTNWDLIGRKDSKTANKKAGGRNLWGPHTLKALTGIRVRKAISGCTACHSIIITETGKAMSWGRNEKGQLGHNDEKRRDVPTLISTLNEENVVNAACGRSHSLVLTAKGEVYGFGDNKFGQCGIGTNAAIVSTPTKINYQGAPFVRVSCGGEFSMIVDVRGFLFSFGCPEYGQLGHNTDGKYFITSNKLAYHNVLLPKRISIFVEKSREGHIIPLDSVEITDVACGANHSLALDNKKRVYSWGFGGYGRLGHAEPKDEMMPRNVKYFDGPRRGAKSIYAGGMYSIAISELGALFFWGQTKTAGEATMYPKPVQDLAGWNVRSVGTSNRSIVVAADESVISWGPSPTYGELGYGDSKPKSSTIPQEVKPVDGLYVIGVACGYGHTMMIAQDTEQKHKDKIENLPVHEP